MPEMNAVREGLLAKRDELEERATALLNNRGAK